MKEIITKLLGKCLGQLMERVLYFTKMHKPILKTLDLQMAAGII
jgi:hypothetical protein